MAPDDVATLIADVRNVCRRLDAMEPKLDKALQDKADWQTVTALSDKVAIKADVDELTALRNNLPMWASAAGAGMVGVIGSLLTALYFILNYYKG